MKFRFAKSPLIISLAFLASLCCWGQTYSISTIAGQGLFLGDGGPAANARFGAVSAVALGPDGSLYIADSAYNQVRRMTPDGNISIFAGGPVGGYAGDGGPATSALLNNPSALLVDSAGDVYIADSGNHRVRLVTVFGNIQTVAGNGQVAPAPSVSPVYPGEGGPATAAPLNQISALVFASNGDLVISDFGNNRIFRVSSGVITTLAGNATVPPSLASQSAKSATLQGPTGMATDYFDNIYFSELQTNVVRMIDMNGNMTVLIGTGSSAGPVAGGSPLTYPLVQPIGMASDSSFNLYILEAGRISMYTPASPETGAASTIHAIAGNLTQAASGTGDGGMPLSAAINPRSLAVDSQANIYLADSLTTLNFNNRVRIISGFTGVISTLAGGNVPTGAGDAGPATSAQLYFPQSVAVTPQGTLLVADSSDNRIRSVAPNGVISTVAGTGNAGTAGSNPGPALAANLNHPSGLAMDSNGNLYYTDGSHIWQMTFAGMINLFAGGGSSTQQGAAAQSALLTQAGSLAVDAQNDVYVDQSAQVSEITSASQLISTVAGDAIPGYSGDGGPATAAQIGATAGIAVDAGGNLYIADAANGRVREVSPAGNITTIAGGGTSTADGVTATTALLNNPSGVAVDGAGNVYIAERGGNRIRRMGSDGNIHTIAGNGLAGFDGDGALATNASLNGPADLKVDSQGNVYIADSLNSAIRKLTPTPAFPAPVINTVSNAGSVATGPVTPGERVIIAGAAMGSGSQVMFDAYPAPVLTSWLTGAVAVVPYEVASQTSSQVTLIANGVTSAPFPVRIASSAPGVFTLSGTGSGQAFALGQDGSFNSPSNPVQAGSIISVLCTGEGVVSPAVKTGVPIGPSPPSPVLPVTATIDGEQADISQAYSLSGTVGQFVVDIIVPYDANSDQNASVLIMVGNALTQTTATISVAALPDQGDDGDGGGDGSDLRTRRSTIRPGAARPVSGPRP